MPSGGIGTAWLSSFQSDVSNFVTNFVVGRIVTTLAAYFVLRAILDTASGGHPLPSVLAAMFLLGTQATYTLIAELQQRNPVRHRRMFSTVFGIIWPARSCRSRQASRSWAPSSILLRRRPAMRLVAVALAMLCVSGIWKLVLSMEA